MPTSRLKSDTSVVSWYIRCGRFVVMDTIQRNSVTSGSAGSGLPIATTAGQQSADSFRNAGPWNHLCREESDEAGMPREASSAGLTSPGTWRHCVGTELSRISVMPWCPTNAWNRRGWMDPLQHGHRIRLVKYRKFFHVKVFPNLRHQTSCQHCTL